MLNRYKAGKESLVSLVLLRVLIEKISAREGGTVIYHECKVLNTKAWHILDNEPQEAALSGIMEGITFLHDHYAIIARHHMS